MQKPSRPKNGNVFDFVNLRIVIQIFHPKGRNNYYYHELTGQAFSLLCFHNESPLKLIYRSTLEKSFVLQYSKSLFAVFYRHYVKQSTFRKLHFAAV